MNKNRFRIIFNVIRGVMMVVAEFVKSHTACAESPTSSTITSPSSQSATTVTMRPLAFAMMLALGLIGIVPNPITINPAHADIIADPSAPANQRPVVMNAANGVPLVNIQTPSAAGVSRNTYSQFDVNANGAILNNSRTNVQTQLGGYVQGNPNLATGSARIILNEVNSHNPSLLNGYVEVAGSRAQVVIANPAGISCNGCGFINASRATLTTGTPIINNGDLMGYRVGGGVINFLGAGLDTANNNYTDVIARAVNVNAGLWAQDLNIITGSNQVNVASNGDVTGISPISPTPVMPDGGNNPTPNFAIDVAALGGMYAGKIHMIGTEAGLGVRNAGEIGASVGEVSIDVNGMLTNTSTGLMSSAGNTQVTATNGVNNRGALYAQGNITLTTGDLNNQAGYIGAKGVITANSTAINNNTGTVISESGIAFNGVSLDNQAGSIEANGNIDLNITNHINNQNGLLRSGQTLTLAAANVDNHNTQGIDANNVPTQGIEAQHVSITADQIDNSSGTMRADNALAIIGSGTLNNNHGTLSSTGTLSITDRLADANSNVAGKTLAVTNTDGTMIAGTDLAIDSNSLTGDGKGLSKGNLTTKLTSDYTHTGKWQANGSAIFETTGTLTNQASLLAGNALSLTAGTLDNQVSGEIVATTLHLNATDTHTLTNRGLIDGSDTFIDTITLNNIGTGRIYGDHVTIAATTLTNDAETVNGVTSAAVIAARDRLDIGATTITNQNGALIFSAGDMAIGGALDSNHQATGTAGTINNISASIEALTDLSMDAATLNNQRSAFSMDRHVTGTDTQTSQKCEDPPDCDYISHITATSTTYQDYVTSDAHAATILVGRDASFTIGGAVNAYSTIESGRNFSWIGTTLSNQGAELYEQTDTITSSTLIHWGNRNHGTTTWASSSSTLSSTVPAIISAGGNLTGSFTDDIDNVSIRQHTALTEPGSGTQLNAVNTGSITQTAAGASAVTLPNNSLFHSNPNPTNTYYVETDPQFANYRNWLSSDYMLSALALDPALTQKRLGDGFYEQKLLREQIAQLTGRRFLTGYTDDEAQYQALMSNGITFAQTYQLTPGIALSAAQIAQLTSDIVWLVEKTVTLADGSTVQALVPQVYARLQASDLTSTGTLLTGNNVHLNTTGDINNNSTIAGREVVSLTAENIHNLGGRIQAGNQLTLTAKNDLNVTGTTSEVNMQINTALGSGRVQQTNVNRLAGLYVNNPNGVLVASAGNNLNLNAAEIVNNGSDGTTSLSAGNDVNLSTVKASETADAASSRKNWWQQDKTNEVGTTLQTNGDLTLQAGNNLTARAATVTSDKGTLTATAGNDLTIEAGQATTEMEKYRKSKKSGMLSSKTTVHYDTLNSTDVIGSTFSGNNVNIAAGNNLAVKASNIVGTNDVNLDAGNNVMLTTEQATHDETHYKKVKQSGLSTSGASITLGGSKLTNTNDSQQVTNVGSTVGSVEGNVNITSGNPSTGSGRGTYNQTGSDVLTPQGDINIAAQQVNITNATDTYANQQSMKYKQSGITLAISNPVVSAVQTTNQMVKASKQTSDPRMQALAAATTALAVNNAAEAVTKSPDTLGGVNLSLSIGTSKSSSKTEQTNNTAKSSTLNAGGDVNVTATGAGKDSDINVIGSQIKAVNDVTLKAEDQINLLAVQNVDTLNSKNKNSSASVGVSVGTTSGFAVTASASKGKGKANGTDVIWTETQIQSGNKAGDTVTLQSGTDTTLKGAQVTGNQVVADVGTSGQGNLNIESLQDSSTYKSKQSSAGISVSVPIGAGSYGGSISASNSKTKSDYASVNEQSGILAGDGGFQVNVKGNTDLKGAVIASTDKAIQDNANSLTTQTLTTSNIQNKAEYDAKAFSATVGAGTQGGLPQLSGAGIGQDSDDAKSITVSAISGGNVKVTDNNKQIDVSGNDAVTTVALLNRNVHVNEKGEAVDSNGNSTANTISPIFDKDKVQREIQAQVKITQAFSQEAPRALNTFVQEKIKPYQDARKVVRETEALLAKANQSDGSQSAYKAELQDKINQAYETMADTQDDYDKWKENGEYRIASNIIIAAVGGGTAGVLDSVTKESLSWAADVMRQNMIKDSEQFAGICVAGTNDCISNKSGSSDGVNGDSQKIAGGRIVLEDWCREGGAEACIPENGTRSGYKENADGTVIFKPVDKNGNKLSISEFLLLNPEMRSPLGGHQGSGGQMELLGIQFDYAAGSFWDKLAEAYSGTHDTLNSFIWYDELGNGKNLDKTAIGEIGEVTNMTNVPLATPFALSVLLPPEVWSAVFTFIKTK
ncbi:MAG: hemagglutinin repeat-containing protein [Methylotenera sp.]|nr:hemagglutinin repeat-containing protein [Methylotenera sp.]